MSKKYKRYTEEFKLNIVKLANSGKSIKEIVLEFDISRSTIHLWQKNYNNSQSFKARDNKSEKDIELLELIPNL